MDQSSSISDNYVSATLPCPVRDCGWYYTNIPLLLKHLRTNHAAGDFNDAVVCRIDNCGKSVFSGSYHGYRMHAIRYHGYSVSADDNDVNNLSFFPMVASCDTGTNASKSELQSLMQSNFFSSRRIIGTGTIGLSTPTVLSMEELFFFLCLLTREEHTLPNSVYKSIISNVVTFIQTYHEIMVADICSRGQYVLSDINSLWRTLSSDAQFTQKCESIGYIEPVTIFSDDCKPIGHYIPILKTLKRYLGRDDVYKSINNQFKADRARNGFLSSYVDGSLFKHNLCFIGELRVIRIHMFVDEFENCNPIGMAKGIHKVTGFYFIVGNVEKKYLSNLNNMFLLCLSLSSDVALYGYSAVLQPFINDLIKFESIGLEVVLPDNTTQVFYGGLATISGDNLGSNDIGGFRKCWSSGKFCRFCLIDYSDLKTKYSEQQLVIRTPEMHRFHVNSVIIDNTLQSAYGVNGGCCFDTLQYFNSVNYFPSDLMHDFLCNGVLPAVINEITGQLHKERIISDDHFRSLLQAYRFPTHDKKNVPVAWLKTNSKSKSLSASQAWCLFRHLPLIIGQLVPANFAAWELYTLLARICNIIFAPVIPLDQVNYLDSLCHDFYYTFLQKNKIKSIIPKFHFMLHYSRQLLCFGPLRNHWCFRFESFHQKLKTIVRRCHNYKNVTYTISKRLMFEKTLQQCHGARFYHSEHAKLYDICLNSPEASMLKGLLITQNMIPEDTRVVQGAKKFKIDHSIYRIGDVHVIDVDPQNDYIFLLVKFLITINSIHFMVGKLIKVNYFDTHLFSYNVYETFEWKIIPVGNELTTHPLNLISILGNDLKELLFIRMRYLVVKST